MTATVTTTTTTPAAPDVEIAIEVQPDGSTRTSRMLRRLGLAVALAVPFLCSWTLSEFANTVMVQIAIAVVTVAGLHMLVHWAGQISLAQVALMGVGAFVTARANADFSVPLPLAIVLGMAGAVIASLAIGLPALRIRGLALAITTLAFAFAASRWLFLQHWLVPQVSGIPLRDRTLFGFDITQSRELVIPVGLVCVAVVALTHRLGSSTIGRSLRMVAHDEEVASAYGIAVPVHKLLAFCYSAACAGLAGAFTVISIGRVGPPAFPVHRAVLYLSAVLLGGPGPVFNSLQAAGGFAAFPVLFRGLGRFIDLIGPLAILAVVIASPAGLNGLHRSLHDSLSRRRRHRKLARTDSQGGTS
ncbi:MAG TPA: branched-chain amino acid ABC transporter permease [Acidimicrobiia bacterium]|jgi:branched-chain amino acid transport system permease protein|nr:branched-chain amino acid ABC transporter permease [Acidimicrobiia bacterium]